MLARTAVVTRLEVVLNLLSTDPRVTPTGEALTDDMTNEAPSHEHDAVTIARLERLAARRVALNAVAPNGTGAPTAARRKRNHPSKKSRAGALALSFATTGGLTYAFATSAAATNATSSAVAAPVGFVVASSTAATATTGAAASTGATATTSTAARTGTTTVNGAAITTKYGDVQVQAVFAADGSLSAVNVLQSPNGDNKSININNRALPTLNSEAVTAQSANVHTVSGATYTTNGYVKSLQSAIDAARATAVTKLA